MRTSDGHIVAGPLLAISLIALTACDQLRMPRLTYEPDQVSRLPVTIKLDFDQALQDATVEQSVCADTSTWQGQLGEAIEQAFVETGRRRFASVILERQAGIPSSATSKASDLTVSLRLVRKSFEAKSRTGSLDQYLARLEVVLGAAYQDRLGRPIGEAPLEYADDFSVNMPSFGSGGTLCQTGVLDEALHKAAEHLANQMVATAYRLTVQPSTQAASPGGQPMAPSGASVLTLRAQLLDENDNQILEGGEKIGVRIDATNTGAIPIGSASVVLSGTPALVDAFASVLASPVQIGPLQPGETKSTVFWGRLLEQVQAQRGELKVSVLALSDTAGGGRLGTTTDQTLVAAIRPGSARGSSRSVPPLAGTKQDRPAALDGNTTPANHYAVVVGLDQYRDPSWSSRSSPPRRTDGIPVILTQSAGLPRNQILFLKNEFASRADLEEAITTWLPDRVDPDSVVFFYFAGQAVAEPRSGDVLLIPYDGSPTSSPQRLLSLRTLQGKLASLSAKLCLLLIEAPIVPQQSAPQKGKASGTAKAPNWQGSLDSVDSDLTRQRRAPVPLIQIVGLNQDDQPTEGLLSAFTDEADTNRDGRITVGEFLRHVRKKAKVYPTLSPLAQELAIPLVRVGTR